MSNAVSLASAVAWYASAGVGLASPTLSASITAGMRTTDSSRGARRDVHFPGDTPVNLLRRWWDEAGGGRGRHHRSRRFTPAYRVTGGSKRRNDRSPIAGRSGTLAPTTEQRRVIAKPVEVRHSPATVTVASSDGSPVADPAARARSFERKGEAGRCDPPADVPPTPSSEGRFRVRAPRATLVRGASVDPLARSIRRRAAALATFAALLAGCTGAPTVSAPPSVGSSSVKAAPAAPPPATARPAASVTFPLSLTDDEGGTLALPAPPQKIASLTPAVTETLFRLRVAERVVGRVDDPTLYPPEAKDVPIVAKAGSVDVEKIVSLGADLVIAGGNGFNPPDAIAKLRSLKVPVLVVYAPDVDGVFKDIELIGDSVGERAAARALTASMPAGFDQVSAATANLPHPRTFYEIDATKEIFGPAKGSFLESMVRLAGGDPVTTGSTTAFSIPLERLVAADPELILLGDAAYGTKV